MNQAASHLADRKSTKELDKLKDFYRQKGAGKESYTSKKWIGCGMGQETIVEAVRPKGPWAG